MRSYAVATPAFGGVGKIPADCEVVVKAFAPVPLVLYACVAVAHGLATPGCTHAPPHDASGTSAWYMGTKGAYDYFHRGPDRDAGTNFRVPHGEWEFGDPFPLSPDPAKWRAVKLPNPQTPPPAPVTPAAPASQPGPP